MRAIRLPVTQLLITLVMFAIGSFGCGDNIKPIREDGHLPDVALSNAKALTAFKFEAAHNAGLTNDVTATINGTTITATVPFGTNVTALVATFTTTGASVKVASTDQVSGVTANDFTGLVSYTVTAADTTTQVYGVTVTIAPSNAKAITAFSFLAADNAASNLTADAVANISGTAITVTVPNGTTVGALVATFSTTGTNVRVASTTQVSGTTPNDFTNDVVYIVTAADGTMQNYTVTVTVAASSANDILTFSFDTANNGTNLPTNATGTVGTNTISVAVPFGTDVTALVATFASTGTSVTVNGVAQDSTVTPNNFTGAVDYVVHAADNSTHTYAVTVTVLPNTAKEIKTFGFLSADNSVLTSNVTATISGTMIHAVVPFNTNISDLVANFTYDGASIQIGGVDQVTRVTHNDFSTSSTTPVVYRVTAGDGLFLDYTVIVDNSLPTAKDILSFSILNIPGVFNGQTIEVTVPNGTNVTALVPTITISGVSVSPADQAPQNFTNPVVYTVTAADTTTKPYTVTVKIAGTSDKDITRFQINGLDAVITNTSATTGTIDINLPNTVDRTTLAPTVTITGVSVSPASLQVVNFANGAVDYVVTAQDGSTKTYSVTVGVVNGNGTKLIRDFVITLNGVEYHGTLNSGSSASVTLNLPIGTDLSAQTPIIAINGASLSPASGATQNFTTPKLYTVTASDGSTRVYTVTVTATLL